MNRDFRDLLSEFNAQGVEFVVVGAQALAAHGHVRGTKDLDVWVRPNRIQAPFGDQIVSVLSRADLVRNKRASGRLQDLADLERLGETPSPER